MKKNELRIGNVLLFHSKEIKVTEIHKSGMVHFDEYYPFYSFCGHESLKPTSLTEEWLKKFGFEKSEGEEFFEWSNDKTFILQDKEKKYYYPYGSTINIEFVHHFQNLVFALTGEELQIKTFTLAQNRTTS